MARSLTPRTASDLKTVIPFDQCGAIIREHGLSQWDFIGERSDTEKPVTLQELRDWLGY